MSLSRRYPRSRSRDNDTFWDRWTPATRHTACVAILLVIAAAFFAPVIFEGKAVHGTDVVSYRANVEAMIEYEEQTGERALWAPNVFGGMPAFLMGYELVVPQLDSVVNAVRPIAWPASHLFMLFLGVYLLVFYLTRNHFSGLLSAFAFGLTTYIPIILSVGHSTKFIALAYAPYVLLAFVYTLRNPSFLGGLLFAGALALDLRAKHPQITYYVLMLALVWWIVELIAAWQDDELAPFAKSTGWLALGTGGALLMVAHPYMAIYQYKQFSVRGAEAVAAGDGGGGASAWQEAMRWSQGPKELFTLVVADAFGGGGGTYWGPKTFTEGPHYVGGVVAALSGLTVWKVRSRVTWGLGIGVLITMLFALGKYAAWINWPMFSFFPFFESFRAPETWLSISALGLAVLAGIGLDYCLRRSDEQRSDDRKKEKEKTQAILYVFGGVLGLLLLFRIGPNLFFDFEKGNERQRMVRAIQQQRPDLSIQSPQVQQFIRKQIQTRKEERRAAFTDDVTRTLLAVGAALLLLWLYRRRRLSAAWLVGGLVVAIVLIDLWGVDRRYLGQDQFSNQPDREAQIPTTAVDRYIEKQVEASGGPGRFRVLPLQTPYSRNPTGGRAAYASYHYQSIGGYHAAKLQRYQDYIDHIAGLSGRSVPNENALDLMNTRYIVAQQQLPGTRVVYRDQQSGTLVLENPDAVPRGFFVGETEVVEGAQQTWQRLRSSSFDPRRTAVLPEPLDAPVTPIDSGSTAEAMLESFTPNKIEWTVETDAPRLFVASEVYYPAGWNAYLNGEQVPIRQVNYLLRGVHVPEGEHTLVMRFEPKADRYGIWVAGATTAAVYGSVLGILGWGYRRRWRGLFNTDADEADSG